MATRAPSPQLDALDAGTVMSNGDPGPSSAQTSTSLIYPAASLAADLSVSLHGIDAQLTAPTTSETQPPLLQMPFANLSRERRWMDLDYGFDFASQEDTVSNNGQGILSWLDQQPSTSEYSRYLEQAGFAGTDDTDPFAWLT